MVLGLTVGLEPHLKVSETGWDGIETGSEYPYNSWEGSDTGWEATKLG